MKPAHPGWFLCLGAILCTATVCARAGTTLTVSAQANIFGAGHLPPNDIPNPSGGSGGVPPVVFAFPPHSFRALTFTNVTGTVKMGNPTAPSGPDGGNFGYAIASYNGIAGIDAPVIGYLSGVFLDSNEPTDPPPASLNFNVNAIGRDFATLSPKIAQVFFIGDGLTASGKVQEFIVPPTATRLFLGLADSRYSAGGPGYYHDNAGSFSVCVEALPIGETNQPTVPTALATLSSPTNAPTTARTYLAPATPVVLPKDSLFGYAIPSLKLSPGIEFSPDLTHWTPLTNVSYFFKDLDSTNFSQRFYRFPE